MDDAARTPIPAPTEGDSNQSPGRSGWLGGQIDASTHALLDRDSERFLHQSLSSPCWNALERAEGPYLIDTAGRRFLDFHGNWVHQVGHGHPHVLQAVTEQLRRLPFSPRRYTNRSAIRLAERLTALAPGNLDRVLLAPGGAEAMSMALQLARLVTGRHKTVSMWDAFHGATLDAISVGGEALFRRGAGPLLPGTEHVPPPNPSGCPFACGDACSLQCARYIDYVLQKEGDVAAVVAETVRSIPYFPPPGYWRLVREACDRHGALLILDEIPTALGRTGYWFACNHYGVVPDLLVVGKGLGGGVMPLAALLARRSFNVAGDRALGHFTHEKSPVAAAAALGVLDVIETEDLLDRSRTGGTYFLRRLQATLGTHRAVCDLRGRGLLVGIELDTADRADAVLYAALERGLSFKVTAGRVLCLVPPLTITDDQLDRAVTILQEAVSSTGQTT